MSAVTDAGAEREIDLGRWKQAAVERWWLVAGGIVVGAVVGAILSLAGGSVWSASVLIAPGQPFSPSGSPVLSYQSSPRAIEVLVTSESALERGAAAARMPLGKLRGKVSTQTVSTGASSSTASRGATLIKVTVQANKKRWAEDAADALGSIVISDTTGPYVRKSIATYTRKEKTYNAQLASLANLIATYNKSLGSANFDFLTKLVVVNQLDAAIQRQGNINDKLATTDQQLTLAQNVEIAQFISHASGVKTTARSRRNSILVGALIGLLAGVIAAIVADIRARRT